MSKAIHRPGNLLLELTSFVGRRRDVGDAKRLLGKSRLVTLTGLGGVGKTRLALQVASAVHHTYPDGVWLVELAEHDAHNQFATSAAKALGLDVTQSANPLDDLAKSIGAQHMLLILDNCEHLVEYIAFVAKYLLCRCANLRILATSREVLDVGGEAAFPVKPLAFPDRNRPYSVDGLPSYEAVALFTERAVAVLPEFTLTEINKGVVAGICQQLDGLPLPIELAASRLRAMSVQQLSQQLSDEFEMLTMGARGSAPRQQSLRACIDWSHNLCTEAERNLWARLSIFQGSFELDAADEICGLDLHGSELVNVVTGLVKKSVLQPVQSGGAARYQLPETLRNYGRERLRESGAFATVERLYRNWYVELALKAGSDWLSARQVMWVERLEWEHPNLRAVLSQFPASSDETPLSLPATLALRPYWITAGRLDEFRYWLGQAMHLESNSNAPQLVDALCTEATLASSRGEFARAHERICEARRLANFRTDRATHELVTLTEGQFALASGNSTHAVACFEKTLSTAPSTAGAGRRLDSLLGLAQAHRLRGDMASATLCNKAALAIAEPYSEAAYLAVALAGLASSISGEDPTGAAQLLRRGLELARRIQSPLVAAECLEPLAFIAASGGRTQDAAVLMSSAVTLRQSAGILETLPDSVEVSLSRWWSQLRRQAGDRVLDKCVLRGQSLTLGDSIEYALGEKPSKQIRHTAEQHKILTRREREVSELVAQGLTNRAIAELLVISQRTAQGHVEHVLSKLGFTSRVQIAAWVVEQNVTSV